MAVRPGSRRSRREPLSRERVLRAAFDLASEGGIAAVTMQRIGERLGVEAMSLYRHVANKEDILDGLVDLILSEIALPQEPADWKTALRQRAISAQQAFSRHRWAIGLVESRTHPGPATLRHHEWVIGILLGAGFSSVLAANAYNLLDSYVYGFAMQEASLPFDTVEGQAEIGRLMLEQIPVEQFPNLVRVTMEILKSGSAYLSDFEFGLDLILDGLERLADGR